MTQNLGTELSSQRFRCLAEYLYEGNSARHRGVEMDDQKRCEALTELGAVLEIEAEDVLRLLRELLADDAANDDDEPIPLLEERSL